MDNKKYLHRSNINNFKFIFVQNTIPKVLFDLQQNIPLTLANKVKIVETMYKN